MSESLAGKKFGDDFRWTITEKHEVRKRPSSSGSCTFWLCVCQCGLERWIQSHNLKSGRTKSCRECSFKTGKKRGRAFTKLSKDLEILVGKIPDAHIAEKAGLSRLTVYRIRKGLGIATCPRLTKSEEEKITIRDGLILDMREAKSVRIAAQKRGVTPQCIYAALKKYGLTAYEASMEAKTSEEVGKVIEDESPNVVTSESALSA